MEPPSIHSLNKHLLSVSWAASIALSMTDELPCSSRCEAFYTYNCPSTAFCP